MPEVIKTSSVSIFPKMKPASIPKLNSLFALNPAPRKTLFKPPFPSDIFNVDCVEEIFCKFWTLYPIEEKVFNPKLAVTLFKIGNPIAK